MILKYIIDDEILNNFLYNGRSTLIFKIFAKMTILKFAYVYTSIIMLMHHINCLCKHIQRLKLTIYNRVNVTTLFSIYL